MGAGEGLPVDERATRERARHVVVLGHEPERQANRLAVSGHIVEDAEAGAPEREHRANHAGDSDFLRDRSDQSLAGLPSDASVEVVEKLRSADLFENFFDLESLRPRELAEPADALDRN